MAMETRQPNEPRSYEIEELKQAGFDRVSSLQQLVCELLVKNQELRMALNAQRGMEMRGESSIR